MKDLRRRFERFCLKNRNRGIPNLMLYIAIGNLIVYVLSVIDPSNVVYRYLCFSRSSILHGQVWRLVTYIFTYLLDTSGWSFFLAAVSLFCYYQFGKILESYWGVFRFNLYYLAGVVLTDLAAIVLGSGADATALNLSLFLAVATIAPEARVLLFFVIPIKMKYLSIIYILIIVYYFINESFMGRVNIVMSLVSFVIFYLSTKNIRRFSPKQMKRRRNYNKQVKAARQQNVSHRCVICGRTDKDYPDLQFRYCSKCTGNKEYCQDHLFTHTHV